MKMIKRSDFTHLLKNGESYFLYNNISGAVVKLHEKDKIDFICKSETCDFQQMREIFKQEEIDFMEEALFYVEQDVDENVLFKKRIKEFKDKKELDVILALTEDCNFRCVYCFEEHIKSSMTVSGAADIIEYIARYIEKNETEYLRVAFYGGEPLLNFEVLQYFYKSIMDKFSNIRKDFMIITNGYLLDKNKLNVLKEYSNLTIQITVDGNEEIHDKRRPLVNGMGTYKKVIMNAIACAEILPTIIRINIDKESSESFEALLTDFERSNVNKTNLYFSPNYVTANTDVNKEYGSHCYEVDFESFSVIERFGKEAIERGFQLDFVTKSEATFPLGQAKFLFCPAYAGRHLVFTPAGDIFACLERISFKNERIGNIYCQDVDNDNAKMWKSYSIAENEKCTKCNISAFCGGECGSKALSKFEKLEPVCGRKRAKVREEEFIF